MSRHLRTVLAALACLLGLVGCDLRDVPVPSQVAGPTYGLDAQFTSALNLPSGAPVKIKGTVVGEVGTVTVKDYVAHVELLIRESTRLPRDTRAEVRLTAPMGEAFVELQPPAGAAGPYLTAGQAIAVARTTTSPTVVDLLAAMSAVITGGSFADVSTIVRQLNLALDGNAPALRRTLANVNTLVTDLNRHTRDIDVVLDAVDRLSTQLAKDTPDLVRALKDLAPTLRSLSRQRGALVRLLRQVTRLGRVATRVVTASHRSLVTTLRRTAPILRTVNARQRHLDASLVGLQRFGTALDRAAPGDFALFDLVTRLNYDGLNGLPGPVDPGLPLPTGLPTGLPTSLPSGIPTKLPSTGPTLPLPTRLPGLDRR